MGDVVSLQHLIERRWHWWWRIMGGYGRLTAWRASEGDLGGGGGGLFRSGSGGELF